ncbi:MULTISPECIES: cation:proton antiporter [Aphanizomenon]|uniref:Cation:proton antiporter n=1 Tax=Aphanizomenon flos-aquae FACHB-1249 TaxID=2692889 RepID=A0ABR8INN7_APHFL|nr:MULTISPECIES: cation:proton antiporter [Aphanizomenon]MBD2390008.1 cation:proton antiporter [Aphanizomenon flos-aquae FACHB-1171]MBD2555687.1 cation:proton antiporter [Aphanizomenon flos-aquae FACHB-1290]MBD2630586.1 cation:proton antiporter [Aphanizomenon sp. FACHB-1399]MBD2641902.1 cation:proton antiporter [Aphanizomenon sp. FACHB-1401]MBD2656400.1 cation:proton antiporter [Aphanizomenon flos-aquae FACHB-1265]
MHTVVLVLIEVLIVIGLSRLVGLGFKAIKQPLVIGEIFAGIMLGPSLFGLIAPGLAHSLFPAETMPYLNVLSQIGLIFFMFLIGLELNPKYLSGNLKTAILISNLSIIVPFASAFGLSFVLYPLVSNNHVNFAPFALFLGAAMSITAFPVLARIITENNLQGTRLGTLALTCAAVDDVTAWCILAVAIAVARHGSIDQQAILTIIESVVYIGFMFTIGRWFLKSLSKHHHRAGRLSQLVLAIIYMGVVASALITEFIGIHLIFGAFLLGAVMPKDEELVRELAIKTEDFVLIFLLPIFFAYSGLKTQIGLLNSPNLWLLSALILLVAIGGKYTGTYVAARLSGIDKREASALGWLMNTRGLTELIVLNIGLELGVITPLLFTMLVIMALVTTFMTSPLLEWTYPKRLIRLDIVESEAEIPIEALPEAYIAQYRILVPVANPAAQKGLLQLATAIAVNNRQPAVVYPLSFIELEEDYGFESSPNEADRLIAERCQKLEELIATLEPPEIRSYIHPIVRISSNVARETAQIAKIEQPDLVLLGWHRPAFSSNRLGGRVGQILGTTPVDVAVFVDKGGNAIESLLVPYSANIHDDLALIIALRMLINRDTCMLQVLQVFTANHTQDELSYELNAMIEQLPKSVRDRIEIKSVTSPEPMRTVVTASENVDLTIVGTSRLWGIERQTLGRYTDQLAIQCRSSLLITRRYSQVTSHLTALLPATNTQEIHH